MKFKISGTGWLCLWSEKLSDWIPVCQLTAAQVFDINLASRELS